MDERGRARLARYEKKMRKKARRNDRWGAFLGMAHYHDGRPCFRDHKLDPYRVGKRTGIHADRLVPAAVDLSKPGAGKSESFTILITLETK